MNLKTYSAALISLLYTSQLQAEISFHINQTVIGTGDSYKDESISIPSGSDTASGEITSHFEVLESGIRYQLISTKEVDGNKVLTVLDETITGQYPSATLELETRDNTYPVDAEFPPRTRADEPYYVTIKCADVPTGDELPYGAKHVNIRTFSADYVGDDVKEWAKVSENDDNFTAVNEGDAYLAVAGDYPPSDEDGIEHFPKVSIGEEEVRLYVIADAGTHDVLIQRNKISINVWPVAVGGAITYSENAIATDNSLHDAKLKDAPSIHINADDLYPTATVGVRIKHENASTWSDVTTASGEKFIFSSPVEIPQYPWSLEEANVPKTFLSGLIDQSGDYTVEVFTLAPFAGDNTYDDRPGIVLSTATFHMEPTLRINASSIMSAE